MPSAPAGLSTRSLYLLRHAKSAWDDPSLRDHARPLASRGLAATAALRRYLADERVEVDLVLCSTAERTRRTWDELRDGVGGAREVRYLDEIYEAIPDTLLGLIRGSGDAASVLLVGHNPGIGELATGLTADPSSRAGHRLAEKYPTGALAAFTVDGQWSSLGYGAARLDAFVRPRDLPPG